ncbi:MAG TPA: FAD-dependent oxidoreductase, partial [Vicinamibacterales bacterium]
MSRSPALARLRRSIRIADFCEHLRISTAEGIDIANAHDAESRGRRATRREWLTTVGRFGAAAAVASVAGPARKSLLAFGPAGANVGIVGAGLAGLVCADELANAGIAAALYDANTRTGGRCFSLPGFFPSQVAERGGEFIDNAHKTLLKLARRFRLELEDVNKVPGDVFYFLDGQLVPEAAVVDEYRDFVRAMRIDLRALSQQVTAESHTPDDVRLDRTNLLEYLEGENGGSLAAGPIAREAIIQAYIAEFGLEPDEQSCLNFLLFIHADRRSKFTPFGIFSDERWHVVSGNDRLAAGLTADLPNAPQFEMRLVRVR